MVFIFLTPQPNNYSAMLGVEVKSDLISTLKEISKGATVATYQTCLDSLRIATSLVSGKVQIILSNGSMIEVTENSKLEDIMELEKSAIEDAFATPRDELIIRNNINEIKVNAMDFYQAAYCDENAGKIEGEMIEAIKQTKQEEVGVALRTELDVVDKIITAYNIEGKISGIECNGNEMKEEDFFNVLGRIVMDGFTIPKGSMAFKDTPEFNYIIAFDSNAKIIRKNMEFQVSQ